MYSCYMEFLCQKILYKHGSASHRKNNFVPCHSFIVKAHQSTHSLAHGWFLIAFHGNEYLHEPDKHGMILTELKLTSVHHGVL